MVAIVIITNTNKATIGPLVQGMLNTLGQLSAEIWATIYNQVNYAAK